MSGILSMILAGGEGTRLFPFTSNRAKPAVPFGGSYRIIDFVLNNFVNSDLHSIFVLTQFKSHSLMKHLSQAWRISGLTGYFIDPIPAQMRMGKHWYKGTCDAIYQNLNLIDDYDPEVVCVFGGDHIYKMEIRQMIDFHKNKGAELTVAAIPVPVEMAGQFGVIEVDENGKMIGFEEKPKQNPKTIPNRPTHVMASMGNYVFDADAMVNYLQIDAEDDDSIHDFGYNILPMMFPNGNVYVYDFSTNVIMGEPANSKGYWRDVGTVDAYYEANMDLIAATPSFDLYNRHWPLRSYSPAVPPAKFVHNQEERTGHAINSAVSSGCIISGALVNKSILGYRVHVHSRTSIEQSVIMGNTDIGPDCRIRRAIIDKDVMVAPGTIIGENPELDRQRFQVSEGGVVVIPKGARVGFV
ncbi:glucose-1-phosphate adenylyltransferase [Desulfobacter hydrogenophilus]|uniref:Glucose-1-phosphate adenylyltransferase n=1 Tax=Desulfobacter hydrogenophilus TaxID=2291 RepID=A0A328FKW5_9BACT|nr:glucose-1-phosphate adenylyltransferase [Desulfobacter hydrogenophilus]NDY72259.1 glucose-1-phosphate adenylyltransferase [Desulfobacter hydrogenophilus]QBH12888.1 glucose-1-phosphate adenylyltransferase [Desulfobacter hydrogenophilus]RAM03873.1 glucose-1-phosphate adenylyltransferase [Desulfobacter hydrogenophilus]